jgi:Fic/DOC family
MLGYRFCLTHLGLPDWPLRVETQVGPVRRRDRENDQHLIQTFPASYGPKADCKFPLFEHLKFAIGYEGIDLAALAAIFGRVTPAEVGEWVSTQPSSKYARKLGFLYEWLTAGQVPFDASRVTGAYEPVLDEQHYFTGAAQNVVRWHVRNNLPGTPQWCPTAHRTTLKDEPIGTLDIAQLFRDARTHVAPDIFERALSYAYLAETQASYAIEHDAPTPTQKHAFLRALQAAGSVPMSHRLTPEGLSELQELVFHGIPTFVAYGLRQDDGFVGSAGRLGTRRIDYPCPPARAAEALIRGLRDATTTRLAGTLPPVVFAGLLAFGFVFIHPLGDGNGRIHRFFIHEGLVECGAVERGALIPVSATMLAKIRDYDAALRAYSTPIRQAASAICATPVVIEATEPFQFTHYEKIAPLYQYPVLTDQIAYLERTIRTCIEENLVEEARFLMQFDRARALASERFNMSTERLNLLIELIHQNGGTLSKNKRHSQFSDLSEDTISDAEAAVRTAFPPQTSSPG